MKPFVKFAAVLMVALVLVAGCDKLKGMKKQEAPAAAQDATAAPAEGAATAAPAEGAAAAPAEAAPAQAK